jgi:7-carboxy-7-deazaguanine synthase
VSEIFFSIQGEGVHSGTPAVFLRTYYCNLTCTWCDTKYTWLDQAKSKPGVDYRSMSAEDILGAISEYGCKHLVLTGGEPLIHQEALEPLLATLKAAGFFIEVETNGTIAPSPRMVELVDCFNVSPKLSSSLIELSKRVRAESLRAFARTDKAWFKFVISDPKDLVEVEAVVSEFSITRDRVILMPEGIDAATILARSRWLIELCKEKDLRFGTRLHILVFGNRRGT